MPHNDYMAGRTVETQKTWRIVLRMWWSLIWRMMIGLVLFMFVVVVATDYFLINYPNLRRTLQSLSVLGAFPLGLLAFRAVINKSFGDYRLSLLFTPPIPPDPTLAKANDAPRKKSSEKTHKKSDE